MKLTYLAVLALLSGCAATSDFFGPQTTFVLPAGSSVCFGPNVTPVKCEELDRVIAQLHTKEANAAIDAARIPGMTSK